MSSIDLLGKIKRAIKKPPKVILERVVFEIKLISRKYTTPFWILTFSDTNFLKKLGQNDVEKFWKDLGDRPYFSITNESQLVDYKLLFAQDYHNVITSAELAMQNKIDLLGTGLINLGDKIDWHKDYKTGVRWKPNYISNINYSNPNDFSDVKIPWEISRLQWLMPVGQAYLLTKDEKYANKVKLIIEDWIAENPYAGSVNWTCTMEAALRVFTLTWYFHIFKDSITWNNKDFKIKLLKSIWLHGKFTEEHIEKSDVNGNHFTADAAGMVVAGLFFNIGQDAKRWNNKGWAYLLDELPKQVFEDGVNYEASVPYHRLVLELFFYPAYLRKLNRLEVPDFYKQYLYKMAKFSIYSSKPNGFVPVWGDADDARVLPYSFNKINDHRYLSGLVGLGFNNIELLELFSGSKNELIWVFGLNKVFGLQNEISTELGSIAFEKGGFYIMRDPKNHVFIDCGPLGLADRGGHGHNDLLSFEAYLNDCPLIVDSGSYIYTGNFKERNNFRSTAFHNTPQINGIEINRFIRWDYLWNLINDAKYNLLKWQLSENISVFTGSHTGFLKLSSPVKVQRSIILNHNDCNLFIKDEFITDETNSIKIPFHFHPNVKLEKKGNNEIVCSTENKSFTFFIKSKFSFNVSIESCNISFSYGLRTESNKVVISLSNVSNPTIQVGILSKKLDDLEFENIFD